MNITPKIDLLYWHNVFSQKARELYPSTDPSHDFLHIQRVVKTALKLCNLENARIEIVLPAAYFHDFVNIPKNDPRRSQASTISAQEAALWLRSVNYPAEYIEDIKHAIAAHSFSANITATSLEAQIVQDADRLDSLGAIGIARCFATSTLMQRPFHSEIDPWAGSRPLNDMLYAIDHFEVKLLKLAAKLNTKSAIQEGQKRTEFMRAYLDQLKTEI